MSMTWCVASCVVRKLLFPPTLMGGVTGILVPQLETRAMYLPPPPVFCHGISVHYLYFLMHTAVLLRDKRTAAVHYQRTTVPAEAQYVHPHTLRYVRP